MPWVWACAAERAPTTTNIDEARARGMKVKIYDTVRELTNRAPELFALLSLGDEVIAVALVEALPGCKNTSIVLTSRAGTCLFFTTRRL
jgi:hypothetical protein